MPHRGSGRHPHPARGTFPARRMRGDRAAMLRCPSSVAARDLPLRGRRGGLRAAGLPIRHFRRPLLVPAVRAAGTRRAACRGCCAGAACDLDLMAGEVGDVEDVDRLLAIGADMGRADGEVEVGDGAGELVQQARAVEARDLDDGEFLAETCWRLRPRPAGVNGFRRRLCRLSLPRSISTCRLPCSSCLTVSMMRLARTFSSSSEVKARRSRKVSSAWPSRVEKICAPMIEASHMVQAPAISDSSRGWSGV